jgi:glyceraldehyde 3-phosphate dehydrogenase
MDIMNAGIGINGFGRIGRAFMRLAVERDLDVLAVNDITSTTTLAHLLKYDSTYGRFPYPVESDSTHLIINGRSIPVTAHRDPADLDWGAAGIDVVIESTGHLKTRDDAALHLKAGARKVLISAPGQGVDLTVVMGVNETAYDPDIDHIISNASCTTNCVAPMIKVLNDEFEVVKGFMTTIHGYTNDQMLLDSPHKDLHRGRAAAVNIIPTSTGAARATGIVIPEIAGRLDGIAVRVPVLDGSLTDLTVILSRETTTEEVNQSFRRAAAGELSHVMRYNVDPIVSRDIVGDPASCVFDSTLTQVNGELVKVFGWYDNEFGYACRLADLCQYVSSQLQ